jgi:sensor histidine kinase YesM
MKKMFDKEKINRIPSTVIGVAIVAVIAVIAVVLAEIGTWYSALISVCSIILIVIISIVLIRWELKRNVKGVLDSQRMEAEKQAMEMKLQESQISIMLSQIQPHFLYNTLNSIYQLCETNPMRARSMVNFFAEYLRNNLSSLEEPGLISFETELSHIKTYLEIEKIRFEDSLEIEYDIKCVDFSLPVLTVQPIVENAVKHGTSKKRGGGKVTISTDESKESHIIKVFDTGCGFDPSKPKDDGKRHVGIENVRQRLFNMCGGSLSIESEVGKGTLATIIIPKGGKR